MKICLDAGHYGKCNKSPADSRYYESDMVWKLHLMQKKYLEGYGIEVITTRSSQEVNMALWSRGAASKGCDLFISDHSNAVGSTVNNAVDYPASYCAISGRADGIGLALAQCVEATMRTQQGARIERRRGQSGDYYGVLRGATDVGTPGLILEHSFHTNAKTVQWLLNDVNLECLARAEADAIARYYGISKAKKSGWHDEDGGLRFYNGDTGDCIRNDWREVDGKWYWFDGAGQMVTDVWYQYKGSWYYLGSDGAMTRGLQEVDGKWYYLCQDGKMETEPVILTPDQDGALQFPGLVK